jgi:hypothetical protein
MTRPRRAKVLINGRNKYDRYVKLDHWMLDSAAWKVLSPNAKAVLIEIWKRHNGTNNGSISFAVREAQEIGVGRNTAQRAIKELIDLGFLRIAQPSGFDQKRLAREWTITALPVGVSMATKDFMCSGRTESKTQSHQRDNQSHRRDYGSDGATKIPPTVLPAGLSGNDALPKQSHCRDTSILPGR